MIPIPGGDMAKIKIDKQNRRCVSARDKNKAEEGRDTGMFGHFLKWRSEIPVGGGDTRGFYIDIRGEGTALMQRPCGRTLPGIVGVLEEHLGERGSRRREGGEVREVTEGAGPMDAGGPGLLVFSEMKLLGALEGWRQSMGVPQSTYFYF